MDKKSDRQRLMEIEAQLVRARGDAGLYAELVSKREHLLSVLGLPSALPPPTRNPNRSRHPDITRPPANLALTGNGRAAALIAGAVRKSNGVKPTRRGISRACTHKIREPLSSRYLMTKMSYIR